MADAAISDANPGDIYVDTVGKLWRIVSVCREPTVEAEEVEGTLYDPNVSQMGAIMTGVTGVGQAYDPALHRARVNKLRHSAPTGSAWWNGWQRIWRKAE